LSCRLRKDNSQRSGHHRTGFTPYQPEAKEIKEMTVGKKKILTLRKANALLSLRLQIDLHVREISTHIIGNPGISFLYLRSRHIAEIIHIKARIPHFDGFKNGKDPVCIRVEPIITALMNYIQHYRQADGNADGKTAYIDDTIKLIAIKIP